MAVPTPTCRFDTFKKEELRDLADRLLNHDPVAIEWCIAFFETETFGIWHGRARAMIARRLKHCQLSASQRSRLVQSVMHRFYHGTFSEQFKDQLKMSLKLDPERVVAIASECRNGPKQYVRRYADWVLSREDATHCERRTVPD